MTADVRREGMQNLQAVQVSNRNLLERALRMRAVSYLAQQKAALLTQTIFEIDRSKQELRARARELAQGQETISRQNTDLEARARALEEVQRTLEERVRLRTEEFERTNAALRDEAAGRVRGEAERKQLSEQYLRAQKMELVGQLAGGVAHDFNNLLTVVLGYGELMRTRVKGTPLAEDVEAILDASRRGAALTRQLLTFARKQPREAAVLAPAAVVRGFVQLLHRALGSNIELELSIDENAGNVRIGASQLEQVVLNLVVNAKDAMPSGGKLTIGVQRVVRDERDPGPHGACVAFTVRDTGEGMSDEVRARAFEPLFTTKPAGIGTGLGLATVDMIVRDYEGHIEVTSQLGAGTTFTVYLPVVDERGEPWVPLESLRVLPHGQESVLVVDDDAAVRRVVAQQLETLGYRVSTAERATAALAILGREPIDLLLVDSMMPGISGEALATEVALRWQRTAVVMMSGYSDRERPRDARGAALPFVEKPLEIRRLATMLRTVLDRR